MFHAAVRPRQPLAHADAAQAAVLLPLFTAYLDDRRREHLVIGGFDCHGRLRHFAEVSGSAHAVASAIPAVRSVLAETAVIELVMAHNHPDQPALPSVQDRQTTDRVAALARLAGAMLVDHLVFGSDGVFSIAANRQITAGPVTIEC